MIKFYGTYAQLLDLIKRLGPDYKVSDLPYPWITRQGGERWATHVTGQDAPDSYSTGMAGGVRCASHDHAINL